MAGVARVPRSRGGVSGVLLILIGAWGGLAPFVGPYFRFAYTPDKAWAYTSGRLWLSIVPGAAAVLGGLFVVSSSHRAVGCFGAFIAALGGAWFIVGGAVIGLAVKNGSISPGLPLTGALGSLSPATRVFLEQMAFFTGTGVLILFFGAVALGRFSVVGVRDAALNEQLLSGVPADSYTPLYGQDIGLGRAAGQEHAPDDTSYPTTTGQYPTQAGTGYPTEQGAQPTEQYPTPTSPFGQTPPPSTGPLQGPG